MTIGSWFKGSAMIAAGLALAALAVLAAGGF